MFRASRPAGWWLDAALAAGLGAVTAALAWRVEPLLALDLAVRDLADAHRPAAGYWIARVFNYLGQGGQVLTPLAAITAAWCVHKRHSLRPVLPVIAAFIVTYFTIGPLKLWTDRLAASSPLPDPELLFRDPAGMSYPSGHVVNAIVWYGVIALLLNHTLRDRQRWLLRIGPPVIVLFTTTYLSFHWLTDGVAAILLGMLLDRLLRRIPWDTLPLGQRLERTGWARPANLQPAR